MQTVSLSPSTVLVNKQATGKVTIAGKAPTAGFVVQLQSSAASLSVPVSVKIL